MSGLLDILFALLVAFTLAPIWIYIMIKFGAAAFFREKQKHDRKTNN